MLVLEWWSYVYWIVWSLSMLVLITIFEYKHRCQEVVLRGGYQKSCAGELTLLICEDLNFFGSFLCNCKIWSHIKWHSSLVSIDDRCGIIFFQFLDLVCLFSHWISISSPKIKKRTVWSFEFLIICKQFCFFTKDYSGNR